MTTTREAALEAALTAISDLHGKSGHEFARLHPALNAELDKMPQNRWYEVLADRADAALSTPATEPQGLAHIVDYTNWRGETARRVIRPIRMWWGKTEWHPEEQWMLTAWDCEKDAIRDFAWQDMRPVQNPATSSAAQSGTEPQGYVAGLEAVNDMAKVLMDAWAKAEPNHGITKHPTSYVATFADMARAALAARPAPQPAAWAWDADGFLQPAADTRSVTVAQLERAMSVAREAGEIGVWRELNAIVGGVVS